VLSLMTEDWRAPSPATSPSSNRRNSSSSSTWRPPRLWVW